MPLPTKPTSTPTWAVDDNYSFGPDNTLPTKVEPSSGELAMGYHRGRRAPARKMNWLFYWLSRWTQWSEDACDSLQSDVDNLNNDLDTLSNRPQACSFVIEDGSASPVVMTALSTTGHLDDGAYTLGGGGTEITVPANGVYLVTWGARLLNNSVSDDILVGLTLRSDTTALGTARGIRRSTSDTSSTHVQRSMVIAATTSAPLNFITVAGTGTTSVDDFDLGNVVNIVRIS